MQTETRRRLIIGGLIVMAVCVAVGVGSFFAALQLKRVGTNTQLLEANSRLLDEQVGMARAFCVIQNDDRDRDNRILKALRESFGAVQPAPGATREQAQRTIAFRERILATVPPDAPPIDCSGIGDGKLDFFRQNPSTTTTTVVP